MSGKCELHRNIWGAIFRLWLAFMHTSGSPLICAMRSGPGWSDTIQSFKICALRPRRKVCLKVLTEPRISGEILGSSLILRTKSCPDHDFQYTRTESQDIRLRTVVLGSEFSYTRNGLTVKVTLRNVEVDLICRS